MRRILINTFINPLMFNFNIYYIDLDYIFLDLLYLFFIQPNKIISFLITSKSKQRPLRNYFTFYT